MKSEQKTNWQGKDDAPICNSIKISNIAGTPKMKFKFDTKKRSLSSSCIAGNTLHSFQVYTLKATLYQTKKSAKKSVGS